MKWTREFGPPQSIRGWSADKWGATAILHVDGWLVDWYNRDDLEPYIIHSDTPLAEVLAQVHVAIIKDLQSQIDDLKAEPTIEDQESPVELIAGSQDKADYHDGWLRLRPGRGGIHFRYQSCVYLDDMTACHVHPWMNASDTLASTLGVPVGTLVAGIRWTEKPK